MIPFKKYFHFVNKTDYQAWLDMMVLVKSPGCMENVFYIYGAMNVQLLSLLYS